MTSFVESQRLNLSLIARAAGQQGAHSGIMRVFDTTNRHLGRILSDLGAVHIRAFDPSDRVLLADQLMPDVAAVARSYRSYLTEVAADLVRHEADLRLVPIEMPTRTTAGLIQTIRTAIVLEQDDTDEVPSDVASRTSFWEQRAGLVSQVLAKQGPQFVRLWEGSWAVLESASPDRVRQAAHSGRELLMQLLALLAPDHAFTEDELKSQPKGKPTRKMRIRYILTNRSSATVQLIDSIAAALDGLYDRLAGISHDRSVVPLTTEQMITGWLMTLGGLLMLLLDDGHLPE